MSQRRRAVALALALAAGAACGDRPTPKECSRDVECRAGEVCTVGACQVGVTLRLAVPAAAAYSGPVDVEVTVSGPWTGPIDLLADGTVVGSIASPYRFRWETAAVAEGAHEIQARVLLPAGPVSSPSRTVVVDRTPPAVAARRPAPDDPEVAVSAPIEIDFSEPIDPATVSDATVQLAGAGSVSLAKTLSLSGQTLTIRPLAAPIAPVAISVHLSAELRDLAGNPLAPLGWSFTCPTWLRLGGALNLDPGQSASSPSLAVLPGDELAVAFTQATAAGPSLAALRWDGRSWTSLGAPANGGASALTFLEPHLAADPAGALVLTWDGPDSGFTRHAYAHSWNGSAWDPLGADLGGTGGLMGTGAAAFDPGDGRPLLPGIGTVPPSLNRFVFVKRWDGSSWATLGGALNAVDTVGVALAAPRAGRPVAAYVDLPGTAYQVLVKEWTGSGWSALGGPLNVAASSTEPSLAVDPSGRLLVSWLERYTDADRRVFVKRWDGSAWLQLGGALNAVAGTEGDFPRLAVSGSGQPFVAWTEYPAGTLLLKGWNGGAWDAVGGALQVDLGSLSALAVDGQDRPVVAYTSFSGGRSLVYVRRLNR